jgi:chaperone modulatory protein CbpM
MNTAIFSISFRELCQFEGIQRDVIIDIVDYGIVAPIEGDDINNWVFDTNSVYWIKKAVRLYQDLEIDWIAVAMLVDLLQQKELLQRENRAIQQQLRRFTEKET